LKKGGKRFELACYPNKVLSWRNKVEKDLDEVLQVARVFINVSKGVMAKKEDLIKSFNTDDEKQICIQILEKGELQVSEKERQIQLESLFKDVATLVAEKCVNPETKRPLTVGLVERSMKDIHYNLHPTKSAKQQALEVIKALKEVIPIQRAQMRLRIVVPVPDTKKLKDKIADIVTNEEESNEDGEFAMTCLIDPGSFRKMDDEVRVATKGKGKIEILSLSVAEGEASSK